MVCQATRQANYEARACLPRAFNRSYTQLSADGVRPLVHIRVHLRAAAVPCQHPRHRDERVVVTPPRRVVGALLAGAGVAVAVGAGVAVAVGAGVLVAVGTVVLALPAAGAVADGVTAGVVAAGVAAGTVVLAEAGAVVGLL